MEIVALLHWQAQPAEAPAAPAVAAAHVPSDEALMLQFCDGDDAAFRQLYGRYRAPLMRFARHLAGAADAEEIFQETWIAVLDARHRYSVRARFTTWLFAIAHRRAADRHRRRVRQPVQALGDAGALADVHADTVIPQPAEAALQAARQQALKRAIAALPFEQREVFLLRAEAGLGVRDIARITHALPETTKSRLRYALRELRKAMAHWS